MDAISWQLYPVRYTREYLETLHTKQLLMLLRVSHRMHYDVDTYGEGTHEQATDAYVLLKDILANREHVPNKAEGKLARQLAAKRKR